MSGLVALFHRDGRPVDRSAIRLMLDAASYRGPDGLGTYVGGAVGLGHAKLALTPEEQDEHQPLVSLRTGCVIVADLRLDNRTELLAKLAGHRSTSTSDAELVLHAYEAWGLDAPAHLLGDFAFVIWDPREERLVCARDTSAQRPLFYRANARTFAAASEVQQLLQDDSVPLLPNEERIRDYLTPLNLRRPVKDPHETFYKDIFSLPSGHVMVLDRKELRLHQYWDFVPPQELRYRRDEDYAEHYRSLFSEVVLSRLRSARPLGALLSGGLDSSSVVCTAHELYRAGRAVNHGFTGLSFVYKGLPCDEQEMTSEIDAKYGVQTIFIDGPQHGGWLRADPQGFLESPNAGVPELRDAVFGTAVALGIRALLTGDLADSCVGGTPRVFDSLLRHGQLRAFGRYMRYYCRISSDSLRKIVALDCIAPLLPLALQKRAESAYLKRQFGWTREGLVPLWMAQPLRSELAERHLRRSLELEQTRRFSNPAREDEYRLLYPPEVAQSASPWPVEIWRPFADRRLHAFLLAVPPEQKFEPQPDTDSWYGATKQIVRRAMRGILPEPIRTRTDKVHFGNVLSSEVARQWSLYEAIFGQPGNSEIASRGYVNPSLFWGRLHWLRDGVLGSDTMYLIRLISMETWLRGLQLPRPKAVTVPLPQYEGAVRKEGEQSPLLTAGRG